MEEITQLDSPQLVEATLLWSGWGRSPWPLRDESSVAQRFDPDLAGKLLSKIKELENEFYASEARFVAADLEEMERMSAGQFRDRHPEVAEKIVSAFAWCYTFDFK
jgi:hypothetical protein